MVAATRPICSVVIIEISDPMALHRINPQVVFGKRELVDAIFHGRDGGESSRLKPQGGTSDAEERAEFFS
jgi:hypothetical protein